MTRSRRTLRALLLMLLACTAPGDAQERSWISDTPVVGSSFTRCSRVTRSPVSARALAWPLVYWREKMVSSPPLA